MSDKNTLNILNGHVMYEYFKGHNLNKNGIYVPFNEAMCVGEVTDNIFSDEFNDNRASAHNVSIEYYHELTLKPLEVLFNNQFSNIVLWFHDDMFCQINLLTLLAYLDQIDYSEIITFNLINHDFKVIKSFEIEVDGYKEIYREVMINRSLPENIDLSVMEKGIKLYLEYLKNENEIISYIREHRHLGEDQLVKELIKEFPQYGLGDTQYKQLIK